MSRPTKTITAIDGARSTTGFVLRVVPAGLTLAKRPSESHHMRHYNLFIIALARELARADHANENQSP